MSNPNREAELDEQIKLLEAEANESVPDNAAAPEVEAPVEAPLSNDPPAKTETTEAIPPEEANRLKDLVEKYKARAEKRDKDLERGLHTAIAEKKQLEETTKQLQAELEALRASRTTAPVAEVDEEDNFPEVTSRVKPVINQLEMLKAELAELRQDREALTKQREEELFQAQAARHFAEVTSKHPDANLFLGDDASEYRQAYLVWAEEQEPEYYEAATNPLSKSSKFVARTITEFKREIGMDKKVETPGLGDIAVKAGAPAKPAPPKPEETDTFSPAQLNSMNLEDELFKRRNDQTAQDAFMAKVERSIAKHGG